MRQRTKIQARMWSWLKASFFLIPQRSPRAHIHTNPPHFEAKRLATVPLAEVGSGVCVYNLLGGVASF